MAKIPVSYQPNKIKKGSYTDWIDGGSFCNHTSPNGPLEAPTSGLNLMDAFDVDWSAYKLDGKDVSATLIIEKLKSLQQIPQVPDRLLYYDNEDGFIANYLVLDDGTLVVDNDKDLALCTQTQDIETDILGAWQQFQCNTNQASEVSESTDAKYNKTISPEYGKGVLGNTLGADHPSSGYGWWYNDGKNIKNDINSGDFNGYIMPFSKQSYAFEMLMGDYETKSGVNTSGDQIGFSIVNDTNALPRRVSTSDGIYYRNTLYDEVQTDSNGFKRPVRSAWVKENSSNSTAKVIFTTSPTKKGDEEVFPSNSVTIHNIVNTKTSIGRKSPVESDETVTIQGTYEASGYLGFLTVVVTNSSSMELAQGVGQNITSGKTGTIFVFGSVFDLDTRKWNSTQIIDGTSNASGTYYNLGRYLVPYNEAYDGADSAKSCIIKSYAQYNNGILKLKFGNPTDFPNKDTANYNGSELTLNFTTQSYDFEPYHTTDQTDPADKQPSQPVVTNIKLPSFTPTVKDTNGVSKTLTNDEFWGMFTGDTKFMYNAYSYEYLYIEVLNSLLDNKVIYVKGPGDNIEYGLNSNRDAYEAKGAIDTQDVLTGSRLVYNPITKKTFYSDGTKIFHIASVNADTEDTPVTGEYLPLAGGEMHGVISMLDNNISWTRDMDVFNLGVVENDVGRLFLGTDSNFQALGLYSTFVGSQIYPISIVTTNTLTFCENYNIGDLIRLGNTDILTYEVNEETGHTDLTLSYISQIYSDNIEISADTLKLSGQTSITDGLHSTASAAYSNVLLGVNNPGANDTGFTDMGTDITKNGYPLVVSTPAQMAEDGEGKCLVFGPGDIYALQKDNENGGYKSSTLYLQHRSDYFGDVLIGRDLTVGYFGEGGGVGGNLTVQGLTTSLNGFKKTGSSDDYVLLAGGGTKLLSDITGDYLPLSGGDMTGPINFNGGVIRGSEQGDDLTVSAETLFLIGSDTVQITANAVESEAPFYAPAFYETSDIRMKDIKADIPLDKCYDLIDKCQTIVYSLKEQTRDQIGLIAQEIEEFFPEVVATDADGFKSLAYDRLVVICFKVLKDIIKRLEKLGV